MNIENKLLKQLAVVLITAFVTTSLTWAGGDHGHHGHEEEEVEEKGPNGGKLIKKDSVTMELVVYEKGMPAELRVYFYQGNHLFVPEDVQLRVALNRLGGEVDRLTFTEESDYWVSDQEIKEPHSFEMDIKASIQDQDLSVRIEEHLESFEGRATISKRVLQRVNLSTDIVKSQQLTFTEELYGVIEAPIESVFSVSAPYPGIVTKVHVQIGDVVREGDVLVTLRNSQNLQSYSIKSPAAGEITGRNVNAGEYSGVEGLVEVTDLSHVWVELSAFPEDIERLSVSQEVIVRDLHAHEEVAGTIVYISPTMSGGHIARARVVLPNPSGHWRPGMHVRAEVEVGTKTVPVAVAKDALQTWRDFSVVFAKYGNTFEVRPLELGEDDGQFVEVINGIQPGVEYVTGNSFLLKADILKDGAKHDH